MTRPLRHKSGRLLYYPDMVKFSVGERVRTQGGQTGTVTGVPIVTSPCYFVLLDDAEHAAIIAEDDLEPQVC